MFKKSRSLLFLLFILISLNFSLGGCWDQRELENLALVQALGLDLKPDSNAITVTTMIAVPTKLGGNGSGGDSGGGDGTGVLIISMDAPSIYEAFNRINTSLNREITLLQNQVLFLGEDLAKQGVKKWVDNLVRFREMRRTLLVFVCRGNAAEVMRVQPKLEKNPAEYFRDLIALTKINGMFPLTNLNGFMERYEAFAQQNFAPLITKYSGKSNNEQSSKSPEKQTDAAPKPPQEIRIIGTAVFKKDKVVGKLDTYETQVLLLLTNKFSEALLTMEDPLQKGCTIIFRLLAAEPAQIKYRQKETAHFTVKLNLEADLISIQSGIDYTNPQKEAFLAGRISRKLEGRIRRVIAKTQRQFHSDIFGFGIKVRDTMLTSTEWDNYHWPEKYPASKIHVKVKTAIRRVGVQFQPPESRG